MERIRVRFAPSPTGPLHIGGARSALFNYLYAKRMGGDFILRIEDTDAKRSRPEWEENIKDSLRWLGITWNEGIDVGGPCAPYRQMERLETYRQAVDRLLASGQAYYCYCSEEEIEAERQAALEKGEMPLYSGKCRDLSPEERAAREAAGIKPVVRFRCPPGLTLQVPDLVRGNVSFQSDGVGDFVIVKSDGVPVYNLAVVVDDHSMGVTHVLRGEEHLSNTPRQVLLYRALGWEMPQFAHISLILGKDRAKMSKRQGSVSVEAYRAEGFLPEAIVNFLALLGWAPESEEEIFDMQSLEEQFSLERVSKRPAVFDVEKLRWINAQYLHKLAPEAVAAGIAPFLPADFGAERTALLAATLQNHLETFADVKKYLPLLAELPAELPEEAREQLAGEQVPELFRLLSEKIEAMPDFTPEAIAASFKEIRKEAGIKGAALYMPVRVAVTGQLHGPDVDKLMALMGREEVLSRLRKGAERA